MGEDHEEGQWWRRIMDLNKKHKKQKKYAFILLNHITTLSPISGLRGSIEPCGLR